MKYKDQGFRPLYKNFCIFPLNDVIRSALEDQQGIDEADGLMVYGFVDHVNGNMLEFIALTKHIDDEKYSFIPLSDESRCFAEAKHLAEEEFEFVARGDSHLYEQFKFKVDMVSMYDVNDDVMKIRDMAILDEFRYQYSFDDVKVILHKEGMELEGVWVKTEALGKGTIIGTVMNKPKQDFGVTTGTRISITINEDKDQKRCLVSNLIVEKKYTAEELADGKILKQALEAFKEDQNQFKFYAILEILRDSRVFVPQTKKGVEIMMSGNKSYFPVYSDTIEMWQCSEGIQKVEMPFLEAVKKAKKDKKLAGLVVNAYSDSFVLPKSLFDFLKKMDK